jgi:hypothetical protein
VACSLLDDRPVGQAEFAPASVEPPALALLVGSSGGRLLDADEGGGGEQQEQSKRFVLGLLLQKYGYVHLEKLGNGSLKLRRQRASIGWWKMNSSTLQVRPKTSRRWLLDEDTFWGETRERQQRCAVCNLPAATENFVTLRSARIQPVRNYGSISGFDQWYNRRLSIFREWVRFQGKRPLRKSHSPVGD